ncbi:MAG: elongation factor G [Thermodesulfobacteriota bacterium]
MKEQDLASVRSVAVIGQGGAGKTTLCEAILYNAKLIDRIGSVVDGTSFMDSEPEEIKRNISISASVCSFSWKNYKFHLVDTPGYSNFISETINCLRVVGGALVVIPGVPDIKVQTENLWRVADRFNIPRLVAVTMLDRERSQFFEAVKQLEDAVQAKSLILQLPLGQEQNFSGVIDLLAMKAYINSRDGFTVQDIPEEFRQTAEEYRVKLVERIAESDDTLLEKYLEEGEISREELVKGLRAGSLNRKFTPVVACSGSRDIGVQPLLDQVFACLPSPGEENPMVGGHPDSKEEVTLAASPEAPFSALVFKTVADPFAGKLSLFRVYSGVLSSDSVIYNCSLKVKERVGQVFRLEGKKQKPVPSVGPGEIGAVAKLKDTVTGNSLSLEKDLVVYPFVDPLPAVITFAIEPKSKADEDKVSGALARLKEEDPVLVLGRDEQTREFVISGLGQMHLETVVEKLKRKFGVEVNLRSPKVPYKETLKRTVNIQGKYKRQSGGRGQYGDVWLELSPQSRGGGFEFENNIVGGAIPRQYIPAVEKGIVEAMADGVFAGYPVVDIKINLYDGSYHSVDSSDMAFKIAGSMGFKKGFMEAEPVLLEPIMEMSIIVPDDKMGDIIGDLNSRRGKVLGMEPRGKNQMIKARVPMAEVLRYASDLRSMTSDRGEFSMEFSRYDEVPQHLAEQIIAESKKKE